MGGALYYSFKKGNAMFFALDSNYMDKSQLSWLETQLQTTNTPWKICYFHHPWYSDGRFHGPDTDRRAVLKPLFEKYGVNVALSGHEHVYERIKPEGGTYYFVLGNSGELRYNNLKRSPEMAAGLDTDRDFMLVQVAGDKFYFQTISAPDKWWISVYSIVRKSNDRGPRERLLTRSLQEDSEQQQPPLEIGGHQEVFLHMFLPVLA